MKFSCTIPSLISSPMPTSNATEAGKKPSRLSKPKKKMRKTGNKEHTSMSSLMHQGRATYAFFERNWNLTKRYWGWELVWFVYNAINALSVSLFSKNTQMLGKVSKAQFDTLTLYLLTGTSVCSYLRFTFDGIS